MYIIIYCEYCLRGEKKKKKWQLIWKSKEVYFHDTYIYFQGYTSIYLHNMQLDVSCLGANRGKICDIDMEICQDIYLCYRYVDWNLNSYPFEVLLQSDQDRKISKTIFLPEKKKKRERGSPFSSLDTFFSWTLLGHYQNKRKKSLCINRIVPTQEDQKVYFSRKFTFQSSRVGTIRFKN